ncbi:periplasmic beta-glucosidase precursor [Penicillium canescens]|uniref:periplasmic beta-glucosidase precursor n=1 Tax=Penicillium canescens TaxID=5083 RepID=UPI0026E02533|nr:periplasmic beta-glucosidase precursor [Penicillium canescens]KAJ6054466.1 periplasmic beta-glucosidase precursor [Penicillium canescens]KAJ6073412.1 periplasmic beta-glucosidase precursor [Penicillium canescens]
MAEPDTGSLLASLTLDEKCQLIAGRSQWRTAAIERLGIPSLKVTDGPSGARGEIFGENVPAAFLPAGVSLGATWDEKLLYEIGQLLGEECKSKSASVLLAPTICIQRHPLGGRNFEAFSEDPYLTGKLGIAYVRGIQSRGVGATPKHFVANDQETKRFKYNVNVPPRALREVYLLPFQMVVRDADPWCMMTAYNKVNGHYCDASKELLIDIARGEWRWDGVFMSDWGGTTSTVESINNGLDLEMPGPPSKRSKEALEKPIHNGTVNLHRVTESAGRILRLLEKAGRFADPRDDPERCEDTSEKRALLRRAAAGGIVMLKNEAGALPLKPSENIRKLGIFGPIAARVVAGGGGSSYIKAPYWTSVYDSIRAEFSSTATEIVFAEGAKVNRYLPVCQVATNPDTGKSGAAIDWYNGNDLTVQPALTTHTDDLYYMSFGTVPPEVQEGFSFRVRASIRPRTSGHHNLSLASIGPAKMYVDGAMLIEQSGAFEEKGSLFFTYGSEEKVTSMDFSAGRQYGIRIDYHSHNRQFTPDVQPLLDPMEDQFQGIRFGFEEADVADLPSGAAGVAADCDAAIIVVGRDKEWETEGQDILSFNLPGDQVRLIRRVAAVCPRTIVLVQAGTPINMEPWMDEVSAILYTWYQGQELGNAAADVVCGHVNPSGRLPVTFPWRIEDCPAFSSFPGEENEIHYTEGLFVGYRWWDLLSTKPLFPIGYGLSYNTFEVSSGSIITHALVADSSTPWVVTARVRNTGGSDLPGRQTVIAWFSQCAPRRLQRPKKQICGFAKSRPLLPGESEEVAIRIDYRAFGAFDIRRRCWVIDVNAEFEILLGTTAADAATAWKVKAPKEVTWIR